MHKLTSDNKSLNFDMRVFTSFIDKGKNNKYSFEQNANGTHIISTAFDGTKKTYSYKIHKAQGCNISHIETIQIALEGNQKKRHFVVDENNKIYEYTTRKIRNMTETFCILCTYENGTTETFIRTPHECVPVKTYKEAEKVRNQIFAYMIAFSALIFAYGGYAIYRTLAKNSVKQENVIKENAEESLFKPDLQSNRKSMYLYKKTASIIEQEKLKHIQNQH